MKIAMIGLKGIPATYGGVEKIAEEMSVELVRRNHEVTVYCRSYYVKNQTEYKGVKLIHTPTIHTKHLDTLAHTFLSLCHAVFQNYDVIHFHSLGPSIFSGVPRLFGIRTITQIHGPEWTDDKWSWFDKKIFKLFEYIAIHSPNIFTTVADRWVGYYQNKFGRRVEYLSSATRFSEPRIANKIHEFGLNRDSYILFVGRLVQQKGCQYLIEAFNELKTDKKLVIAGDSDDTDKFVVSLKKLAGERVVFLGWVYGEMLEELFSNAYIYVHPSEAEGLAVALLQGLGYGNCVVASDIPENLDALQDYGYTFKSKSVHSLKQILQELIDNPHKVLEKKGKARENIIKKFGVEVVVDKAEKLYSEMMK
jgi:glycosyltransferase involved in cell wall biosynthesis